MFASTMLGVMSVTSKDELAALKQAINLKEASLGKDAKVTTKISKVAKVAEKKPSAIPSTVVSSLTKRSGGRKPSPTSVRAFSEEAFNLGLRGTAAYAYVSERCPAASAVTVKTTFSSVKRKFEKAAL